MLRADIVALIVWGAFLLFALYLTFTSKGRGRGKG